MNTMEKSAPLNGESSTQSSGSAPNLPILYSFRRCPYAMRARMAVSYAGLKVELREIELKNKPSTMLELSSKGTVPILVLPDGQLIEESLDIMLWALSKKILPILTMDEGEAEYHKSFLISELSFSFVSGQNVKFTLRTRLPRTRLFFTRLSSRWYFSSDGGQYIILTVIRSNFV